MSSETKRAMSLIVLFGFVSLFGDIVYEGARSVNGPYLKILGANAALVGIIAGIGELFGYAIRLFSGYFADRTRAYWVFMFLGYGMLITVPLLSLANTWQVAALFIVAERLGKALRGPARDTILSQATKKVGTGFGFAIAEFLDQIGAITGPLIFVLFFMIQGVREKAILDYQNAYALLWVPFLIVFLCIWWARRKVPNPEIFEQVSSRKSDKLTRVFWLYVCFTFITTLGFVNFVLVGYHLKAAGLVSETVIPLLYAIAMGVDAFVALAVGKWYDLCKEKTKNENAGLSVLLIIPFCSLLIPLCVFSTKIPLLIAGVILWGMTMGAHETVMRSAIADITPLLKRGTGYGIFNTSYGIALFLGSAGMGFFYDFSRAALIGISMLVQCIAIGMFFVLRKHAFQIS